MLDLAISAASRTGCVRSNNEDMLLVNGEYVRNNSFETSADLSHIDRYLLALADGMGGHQCGEVASSEVLENLHFFFNDIPATLKPGDFNEAICEWLQSINNIISSKGHVDPIYRGMGTTLVALAYYNHQFYSLNCGDSRFYILHEGEMQQMTTDHSLSTMMGASGHSSVITNCIGGGCKSSYIDMVQCTEKIVPSDVILLCSDGLTDMLADADIKRMLEADATAADLCSAAEEAGGFDNVSAIVAHVSQVHTER